MVSGLSAIPHTGDNPGPHISVAQLDFLLKIPVFLELYSPELDTVLQMLSLPANNTLLNVPQVPLTTRAHCWLMGSLTYHTVLYTRLVLFLEISNKALYVSYFIYFFDFISISQEHDFHMLQPVLRFCVFPVLWKKIQT